MFDPDKPIKSIDEDLLDRSKFSTAFAEAILNYQSSESLVIGLYGEWGSGKTSIINITLNHLQQSPIKPIIVKFNPWNFSDQNQLISQFFKKLSATLGKKDHGNDLKKLGENIDAYSKFFEPLILLPALADGGIGTILSAIKTLSIAAKNWGQLKTKDIDTQKSKINAALGQINKKIIIVIDDIDRLNDSEIRQVFQLVKVIADFPNTVYILAFDKNIAINALDKLQNKQGLSYLEKIIQVPFDIPPLTTNDLEKILFKQLDSLMVDIPLENFDKRHWGNIYHSGLKYFFTNLRDITRYINTLKFNCCLIKNYVNIVDLYAITAIQVFEPDVYEYIWQNKNVFAGICESDKYSYNSKDDLKKQCDQIFLKTKVISSQSLKDFLEKLFPKLSAYYSNNFFGYPSLGNWRKEGRICSPDIFDIFFRLYIPKDEISLEEMKALLSNATNINSFKNSLLEINANRKIERFLELTEDYTTTDIPINNIKNIIRVLFDIGDLFPEGETSYAHLDASMKIMRITHQLLNRINNPEENFKILKSAIENAQESIFISVREVRIRAQEYEKREPDNEIWGFSLEQLELLKQAVLCMIQYWADSGKLINHNNLQEILYAWYDWGNPENVKKFINSSIAKDENLVAFITSFLSKGMHQYATDYVGTVLWNINLDYINKFVPLEDISPRIQEIRLSNKFEKFDQKQQKAINVYLDALKSKQ